MYGAKVCQIVIGEINYAQKSITINPACRYVFLAP
jgi:hypothetical protein